MSDQRRRSVAKSLSWRMLATLTTIGIVLVFTGELDLAVAIGGVEIVAKLVIFYMHERAWDRVVWGSAASD